MPEDPEELVVLVGRRVAELRLKRRLTQETLAERAHVSSRYVQKIEAGEENLTIVTLAKMANALRVSVPDLFARGAAARGKKPPTSATKPDKRRPPKRKS